MGNKEHDEADEYEIRDITGQWQMISEKEHEAYLRESGYEIGK